MGTEAIPKSEEPAVAEKPSDFELQIIRQIEYYFGNYNLTRDKFLREQLKLDDGWVPLETMVKFNRLKKLSQDFNVITEALKKSSKQLMEISEDSQKIRRRTVAPIPDDYQQRQNELDERTLYVKGFKKTNTLDQLLDFFKEYNVEHIFMRKYMQQKTKPFKGSVFVTFETKEDCDKFLETKGLKYSGTELLKERKKDYVQRKNEYWNNLREEKEKKKLKKAGIENDGNETEKKTPEIEFVHGCLLKLACLDENCTRENIKEAFEPHGTLVYVDYSKGKPDAVIRFDSGVANSVLEKLTEEEGQKKIEIGSCTAVVSPVEGEEEKQYWKSIAEARAYMHKFSKNQRGFGNKGRYKKYGKRQKGRNDKDGQDEGPPRKRVKTEQSDENKMSEENNAKTEIEVKSEDSHETEIKKEEIKKDETQDAKMDTSAEAHDVKETVPVKTES